MTMLKGLMLKANNSKALPLVPRTACAVHSPCEVDILLWIGGLLAVGIREQELGVDNEIREAALKTFLAVT